MVSVVLPVVFAACGLPNEQGTPQNEVPTPDEQLLGPTEPAPREVRDAAAFQEGALVEGPLVAVINGTPAYPDIAGRVLLTPHEEHTVRVDARVVGLPPGRHGYHVHVRGDCSDPAGESVGGHLAFDRLPRHHDDPQLDIGVASAPEGGPPVGPPGTEPLTTSPGQVVLPDGPERTTGHSTLPEPRPIPTPVPIPVTTPPRAEIQGNLGELVASEEGAATHSEIVRGLYPDNVGHLVGRSVVIHAEGNDPSSPTGDAGPPIACGVLVLPAG